MIGKMIKEYLESKGITQSFVAKKTDLTATQISDICNGKCQITVPVYYRICKALEVPLDTFLNEETMGE